MAPFSAQDIVLEYYSADRGMGDIAPQFSTEVVLHPPDLAADGAGPGLAVDRLTRLAGGEMLMEFTSEPGVRYQIQYSDGGTVWEVSLPAVRAAGNRVQWTDRGLPRTAGHPSGSPSRFYRVKQLEP